MLNFTSSVTRQWSQNYQLFIDLLGLGQETNSLLSRHVESVSTSDHVWASSLELIFVTNTCGNHVGLKQIPVGIMWVCNEYLGDTNSIYTFRQLLNQ